jgi:exonuclease 3'-5' domain-containing protein 1
MDTLIEQAGKLTLDPKVTVISKATSEMDVNACKIELDSVNLMAFDCEGVDLSRHGKLCIIQLATENKCYLFDVMGLSKDSKIVTLIKQYLEDPSICKIIHDCKMDSDATYAHLGIKIDGIHDSQVWDSVIHFGRKKNLNETLALNNCPINAHREKSIYKTNRAYWAKRPINSEMIAYASGDVSSLFMLYKKQIESAQNANKITSCVKRSEEMVASCRDAKCEIIGIQKENIGKLIGRGGSNLRALEKKIAGSFIQIRDCDVLAYAKDYNALQKLIIEIQNVGKMNSNRRHYYKEEQYEY